MHDVLELVDVHLGGGRVVYFEVVSYDSNPCSSLFLIGDLALGAIEGNVSQGFGCVEEILIFLVGGSNKLSECGTSVDEGG
ncbi:unnamed protein product [Fusarium graminearum]|uniref:Uncharacterized protein n=1 Tax=Gibberella zeae TaxID=5518 RepID=A0A4E9ELL2_GIBZA|nr:unnamed protein product [Fusarium graminearum]CAG1996215.1 unnamed protein product [Fusarium graminearum]CAG2004673.1 unnamed protein product [Fusarium graminearum]